MQRWLRLAQSRTISAKLNAGMNNPSAADGKWNQRVNDPERKLAQIESMFQLLFERSTDPIWLFDPVAGVFVDCNEAAVKLLGYSDKSELLMMRPEDLSPPVQADGRCSRKAAAELTARIQTEGGLRFEWLARRASGEVIPLEVVATPICSNDKTLQVVVSRDVSERKRAESELRASEQLLASIVDNISEGVFRTGPGHELIFANRSYLALSGYDSLEELQKVPREKLYAKLPGKFSIARAIFLK